MTDPKMRRGKLQMDYFDFDKGGDKEVAACLSGDKLSGLSQILWRRRSGCRPQDMCKLRSKQENHRRIINPNNYDDQRSRCAIGRPDCSLSQIKPNGELPDREQHRGDRRADVAFAPRDGHLTPP
jgi:hypothetical protein